MPAPAFEGRLPSLGAQGLQSCVGATTLERVITLRKMALVMKFLLVAKLMIVANAERSALLPVMRFVCFAASDTFRLPTQWVLANR